MNRAIDSGLADCHINLRCPVCMTRAGSISDLLLAGPKCPCCDFWLKWRNGVLCALPENRQQIYARFIKEYSKIRVAEGRGSDSEAYYLALPYKDLTGRNSGQWMIRGRTYRYFEQRILPRFEDKQNLDILDLGAGTGWLSYRLARRNHRPIAVDILVNPHDGLEAAHHYEGSLGRLFPLVLAEFDNLPFEDRQFDLAIFNSSLHYSTDYLKTLTEAKRCLKGSGSIIVLDSPIYKQREHGERMREERHRLFEAKFGYRSDSIPSIEFLYNELLEELADHLSIWWEIYKPWYGWRWQLRPSVAMLKRTRPPSRFHILVARNR